MTRRGARPYAGRARTMVTAQADDCRGTRSQSGGAYDGASGQSPSRPQPQATGASSLPATARRATATTADRLISTVATLASGEIHTLSGKVDHAAPQPLARGHNFPQARDGEV